MKPYKCRRCGGTDYYNEPSTGYRRCRECDNARRRNFYAQHKGYRTALALRTRRLARGATPEDVATLLEIQGNACAICRQPFAGRTPHLDHDHSTGLARGLLCDNCNRGLGMFGENPENMLRAVAYIMAWQ